MPWGESKDLQSFYMASCQTNPLKLNKSIETWNVHQTCAAIFKIHYFLHSSPEPCRLIQQLFYHTDCLLPWWSCSNHASWWSCSNHSRKNALKRVNFWAVLLQNPKTAGKNMKNSKLTNLFKISAGLVLYNLYNVLTMLTRAKTTFWEPNRAVKAAQLFGKIDFIASLWSTESTSKQGNEVQKTPRLGSTRSSAGPADFFRVLVLNLSFKPGCKKWPISDKIGQRRFTDLSALLAQISCGKNPSKCRLSIFRILLGSICFF